MIICRKAFIKMLGFNYQNKFNFFLYIIYWNISNDNTKKKAYHNNIQVTLVGQKEYPNIDGKFYSELFQLKSKKFYICHIFRQIGKLKFSFKIVLPT